MVLRLVFKAYKLHHAPKGSTFLSSKLKMRTDTYKTKGEAKDKDSKYKSRPFLLKFELIGLKRRLNVRTQN